MKRSRRTTCTTCGQSDLAHYGEEPHRTHLRSERHQRALRAAADAASPAAEPLRITVAADPADEDEARAR